MIKIQRASRPQRVLFPLLIVVFVLATWGQPAAQAAASSTGDQYKIVVSQPGIYQISHADLIAAGFDPTGIDTNTFQLFNQGQEVVLFMLDGGDSSFDAGDTFLFYGESKITKYTDVNLYWFQAGANIRLTTTPVDGTPAGAPVATDFASKIHFEQDLIYQSGLPMTGDDADRWYWEYFQGCLPTSRTCRTVGGYKNSRSFPFDLPNVSTQPFTATLTIVIYGSSSEYQNPDHQVSSLVNGMQVGDNTFDGQSELQISLPITPSVLLDGANIVTFDFPYLGSTIRNEGYINWFDITYLRDFVAVNDALGFDASQSGLHQFVISNFSDSNVVGLDITSPRQPRWIDGIVNSGVGPFSATFEVTIPVAAQATAAAGSSFILSSPNGFLSPDSIVFDTPTNLRALSQGADYIVISHADFLAQAQQLADYRALANGFRTAVIDVQDIYDEFNYGSMAPVAIRDFISYASHYWQPPRPSYVVLMGDGNYDFLHNLSNEPVTIPPWLAAVDPFQGETAADNRYVDIFGDEEYDSDGNNAHAVTDIQIHDQHMELTVDFGYYQPAFNALNAQAAISPDAPTLVKAIGDMVFWDEDLDGIWDSNERGAPGVTVNLRANSVVTATTVTDAEGKYFFEDIPTDVYQVEVIPPPNWQFTLQDQGTDERYDSDVDPVSGLTVPITYTYPQAAQADWDIGLIHPGTIGNRVWQDSDADGLQDAGESGISGVLINLLQNGTVISTTVTDASGYYYFLGLSDGSYDVQVDAANFSGILAGYALSPQDQGFDTMPDLYLGRFPVNNVSESSEMVNRTIAYETASPSGDWQKRVLFVADNTDAAGNFYAHSDEVADHIWPYPASSQKIYYLQNYANSADVKAAIINGIDQGAIFVTYNGHSSKRTWGDGFFDRVDIDSLNNTIFPIFLPMTCLEGQYINPGFASLAEQAVRTIGKGAVVSWSPTGLGVATGHQFLYNAFFTGVISGETMLGPLTNLAKQALFESHSTFRDLLDTYILLGDPAVAAQIPDADVGIRKIVHPGLSFDAGDAISYTISYSNTGVLTATQVIITDTLPTELLNPVILSNPPLSLRPGSSDSWDAGDLAPGAGGMITITATVDPAITQPTQVINTAQISTSATDNNPANNQSTVTINVWDGPVTLGGVTWYDINGNTAQDILETLMVPNVGITVTNINTLASYTATTDATGTWTMTNIPAGTFDVQAGLPDSLARTTPATLNTTLLPGETDSALNFGYIAPTAVGLADFDATQTTAGIRLAWQTSSEADTQGFYVWRSPVPDQRRKRISALLPAMSDRAGHAYSYLDRGAGAGSWYYWLEAVDAFGSNQFFGPIAVPDPGDGGGHALYLGFILQ